MAFDKAKLKSYAPWILGSGAVIGFVWLMRSPSDDSGGSMSAGGPTYSEMMAANSQAAVAQAQISAAMAQASAMQDAAQAEVVNSQANLAASIGTTYAGILQATSMPQLQAMQASRDVARDALYTAGESQITTYALLSDSIRGFTNMVGGLHASTPTTLQAGASAIGARGAANANMFGELNKFVGGLVNLGGL